MKHLKVIFIAMGSIAALLLLAGSASATTLTSPTGTAATPTIKAASEGHVTMQSTGFSCPWALEGTVESHGSGKPTVGPLSKLTIGTCTGGWQAASVVPGKLEIDWTSAYNGTVKWIGGTIEWTLGGFVFCKFATASSTAGTITGGSPATIHLNATIGHHGGSIGCGTGSSVTGSLEVTTPTSLYVDS